MNARHTSPGGEAEAGGEAAAEAARSAPPASGPADHTAGASPYLAGYLRRIGLPDAPLPADAGTLRALHRAHTYALPFENIDPVLGTVPSLAADDLDAKMVRGGRGGYCYEHNTLLANALVGLGFGVTLLAARVLVGADDIASRPRTHMALLVETAADTDEAADGAQGAGRARTPFLADVGFGAHGGLIEPVPLVAGAEFAAGGRRHRLVHVPHDGPSPMWVLDAYGDGRWSQQYAFTREPFERADFEVVNWHMATNPRSPFARRLFAQRTLPGGVHRALADGRVTETRAGEPVRSYALRSHEELRAALSDDFGITPPGALGLADVGLGAP